MKLAPFFSESTLILRHVLLGPKKMSEIKFYLEFCQVSRKSWPHNLSQPQLQGYFQDLPSLFRCLSPDSQGGWVPTRGGVG